MIESPKEKLVQKKLEPGAKKITTWRISKHLPKRECRFLRHSLGWLKRESLESKTTRLSCRTRSEEPAAVASSYRLAAKEEEQT